MHDLLIGSAFVIILLVPCLVAMRVSGMDGE